MRPEVRHPANSLRLRPLSDERLVARLRAGDSRAFEAIYDRYERPIRSFCRHMLGQPEDADDAAQHTFLAAYRQLVASDKPIELRPWLFTVARNRCRTLLRSRSRGMAFRESMEYEPSVEGLAVEVERREHLRDLMRDIARLPEDQRAALLLTQLDTLRHDEVASVLEVPQEKVKALVFQARTSLVASELARETPCREIREQLAISTGAGLRRGTLRRHVRDCAGCRDFELQLKRQRRAIMVLLPVAAAPAVRDAVAAQLLGGTAAGGAAAGGMAAGGGAAAGGGLTSLVGNALAIKTATVLSVAAASGGVVAVTTGTRVASSLQTAVGAAPDAPAVAEPPDRSTQLQPVTRSFAGVPVRERQAPRHATPQPVNTGTSSPLATPPAQQHGAGSNPVGPSERAPAATQPVADHNDSASGDSTAQPQADKTPPSQGQAQDPPALPQGQAKKPESAPQQPAGLEQNNSDSVPPAQAKKPEGGQPSDGSTGNQNAGGNGNGNGSANANTHANPNPNANPKGNGD